MSKAWKLLLTCAVATAALWRVSADASTNTVEAESFSLASGSGTVFGDAAGSGGIALLIWSNATASAKVSTPKATRIAVRARGDQCSGAPKMKLTVDGSRIYTDSVSATSWTNYGAAVSLAAGTHKIAITFTNDYLSS